MAARESRYRPVMPGEVDYEGLEESLKNHVERLDKDFMKELKAVERLWKKRIRAWGDGDRSKWLNLHNRIQRLLYICQAASCDK